MPIPILSTPQVPISPADDKQLQEFLASLDPKDRVVHELAANMLKTRYDPLRSNAFAAFQKKAQK